MSDEQKQQTTKKCQLNRVNQRHCEPDLDSLDGVVREDGHEHVGHPPHALQGVQASTKATQAKNSMRILCSLENTHFARLSESSETWCGVVAVPCCAPQARCTFHSQISSSRHLTCSLVFHRRHAVLLTQGAADCNRRGCACVPHTWRCLPANDLCDRARCRRFSGAIAVACFCVSISHSFRCSRRCQFFLFVRLISSFIDQTWTALRCRF
jgi:hypothetical protein